jgi:hypothetical protein
MSTELNGLPKQWLHWAQCAGLKSEFRGHRHRRWKGYYLVGRGRRWRVSDKGAFQVSVCKELFDRWALSFAAEIQSTPTSKAEFLRFVQELLVVSRNVDESRRKALQS